MTAVVEQLDSHRIREGRRSPCHPQPFTSQSFCRHSWPFLSSAGQAGRASCAPFCPP